MASHYLDARDQRWYHLAMKSNGKSGMSHEQQKVLKKRKAHIAETIEATYELLQELLAKELIDEDLVKEFQVCPRSTSPPLNGVNGAP